VKLSAIILIGAAALVLPLRAQLPPRAAPKEVGLSQERLDRIRPMMEKYIADNQMAGASALIGRRGKVAYFETFGMMDKEAGKPMAKDAIFRITAMTKPMVVVAALILYEQGKFSMLDPVSKFLPEFANMKVAVDKTDPATGKHTYNLVPAERQITVLDLMRHTSGMTEQGPKDEKGELILPKLNIFQHPLSEGIPLLASAPLVFQPGTAFDYSPGPEVLGRLIEVWSGQPLDTYLEESLFKPLHIVDTGFWVPEAKWSRLATVYGFGPGGVIVRREQQEINPFGITINKRPAFLRGAGGLMSTVTDYTRFLQMLLNKGELDDVRIVSPKSVELMTSDLLGDLPVLGGPMQPGYGFGLTVAVNRGPARTAATGSAGEYYWEGGFATDFFVDPKEKMIMVFMIQKGNGGISISRQFKRVVYQTIVEKEP
jgi:CubicO group peptidase (beta-lactamase class C family)